MRQSVAETGHQTGRYCISLFPSSRRKGWAPSRVDVDHKSSVFDLSVQCPPVCGKSEAMELEPPSTLILLRKSRLPAYRRVQVWTQQGQTWAQLGRQDSGFRVQHFPPRESSGWDAFRACLMMMLTMISTGSICFWGILHLCGRQPRWKSPGAWKHGWAFRLWLLLPTLHASTLGWIVVGLVSWVLPTSLPIELRHPALWIGLVRSSLGAEL